MFLLSAGDYTRRYFSVLFLAIDIEAGTLLNINFCVSQ
jgi:hypothetical protein